MARRDLLVWVDLEMTGLDPERCAILEIATVVTTGMLEVVAEGPHLVVHQPDDVLATMVEEVARMHERSGLTELVRASSTSLEDAARQTLAFVGAHCEARTAPLCGNSVWKDKQFLERYMPTLTQHLHYRIIDVSSVKELARRWYPEGSAEPPKKREAHRALDDVRESIAELQHYRARLFRESPGG